MLIAIIGGKLQGVEAVYLAKKAGWKTLVIDKNPKAAATGLCDRFFEFEFSREHTIPPDLPFVDLILPAVEDEQVLDAIAQWAESEKIPLAFDLNGYALSSSKQKSDALFKKMSLPAPAHWPECPFPVVVKPDRASGSRGVKIFHDAKSLNTFLSHPSATEPHIIQQYLEGPSFSIEVIGCPQNYTALQVTDLEMDDDYDCKRVTAPTRLSKNQVHQFETMAVAIAKAIGLNGIMDVEVLLHDNELKLLEIDARLPSQTPMAVYWSTGINMVRMLADLVLKNKKDDPDTKETRSVVIEHLQVSGSEITVLGEHIMAMDGPLKLQSNFFGANEAITSFSPGKDQWAATLIFCADSRNAVKIKQQNCYDLILDSINGNSEAVKA